LSNQQPIPQFGGTREANQNKLMNFKVVVQPVKF